MMRYRNIKAYLVAFLLLSIATVVPVAASGELSVGEWVSLESYNFPGWYVRHTGFYLRINPFSSDELFRQDATFLIVPGLANADCVSLVSYNYPERYVRHTGYYLHLHQFEDTQLFKEDATFCPGPGLADTGAVSLESYNYPGWYVRHTGYYLRIAPFEDTQLFKEDATFVVGEPLAPVTTFVTGGGWIDSPEGAYLPDQYVWTTLAPMPATSGGPAIAFEDGKIYVFGGPSWNEVEAYDPATDTWTAGTLTPMPTARYAAGVAASAGKIYVIGGSVAFNEPDYKDDNEAYDPATDTWATMTPMPGTHRAYGQAVTAPDGKIYVIGGRLFQGCFQCPVNTVQVYDPPTDAWAYGAPMPIPRQLFAAAELDGKIYAAGGCTLPGCAYSRTDRVDVYDPDTNTWNTVAPLPEARDSFALVASNGRLFALGYAGGPLAPVDVYDPATDTWTPFSQVPTPRWLSATAIGEAIYTFGETVVEEMHPEHYHLTGKANFGFVSKYKKGASEPTGNTEFQFHAADLNFHSSSYEWLVVTGGNYARFKGVGTINGEGAYKLMLWAGDGEPDTFRIRIWEEDEFGVETDIYDNGFGQAIGGGSIVIHTKK